MTLTLTDFLLARIADDERDAHYLRNLGVTGPQLGTVNEALQAVIERVLADCEAKRRIVEMVADYKVDCGTVHPTMDVYHPDGHGPHPLLRVLAVPYADHPDYREEWRP